MERPAENKADGRGRRQSHRDPQQYPHRLNAQRWAGVGRTRRRACGGVEGEAQVWVALRPGRGRQSLTVEGEVPPPCTRPAFPPTLRHASKGGAACARLARLRSCQGTGGKRGFSPCQGAAPDLRPCFKPQTMSSKGGKARRGCPRAHSRSCGRACCP